MQRSFCLNCTHTFIGETNYIGAGGCQVPGFYLERLNQGQQWFLLGVDPLVEVPSLGELHDDTGCRGVLQAGPVDAHEAVAVAEGAQEGDLLLEGSKLAGDRVRVPVHLQPLDGHHFALPAGPEHAAKAAAPL